MDKTFQQRPSTNTSDEILNQPVVGLVDAGRDSDAVAGNIIRAQRAGLHTLFLRIDSATESYPETVTFARELGATIVDPASVPAADDPAEQLAQVARDWGFPGLIYVEDPTMRIDIAASQERLLRESKYVIQAERQPHVNKETDVLVGIPAYNEAETIAETVSASLQYTDRVLVVDDGSTDETASRAADAGATVISHESNQGYGSALKTVFQEADRARVGCLVTLDGDGQHTPSDIPALVDAQEDADADIVIGSRFTDGASTDLPFYRHIGLRIVNLMTNLSLGGFSREAMVSDTQSGFRAYSRAAIRTLAEDDTIGDDMGASTDILYHAHANGYDITEVGTTVTYTVDDANSRNPVSHGLHLVHNILRTVEHEHPILILGLPGFVLTFGGLGFGYWTIVNYLSTGTFPGGLAITSVFLGLTGILSCFTGIILHSLNQLFDEPIAFG